MKNLLLIFIFFCISNTLVAQEITIIKSNGKLWQKMESEDFIFHFQPEQKEQAKELMQIAEESFQYSANLLGFLPTDKVNIFIHDVQPKKKTKDISVILDQENHKTSMKYAINLLLLEDMMGKKTFKKIPEWFTKGAAAFATNFDYEVQRMEPAFNNMDVLKGKDARAAGAKTWQYIADQYGKEYISDLINLCRILEDTEVGISQLLGISYQEFLQSLTRYYKTQS